MENSLLAKQFLTFNLEEQFAINVSSVLEVLEYSKITRPGYGVEYDRLSPSQVNGYFESKLIPGLFFAGQINGTNSYEESAAQGVIAGINASRKICGLRQVKIKKEDGFIGVLTDNIQNRNLSNYYSIENEASRYKKSFSLKNTEKRMFKYIKEIGRNFIE